MVFRRRSPVLAVVAAMVLLGTAGCAEAGVRAAQVSEAGLAITTVTVKPSGGKPRRYRVEIAATPAQQAKGMMFRTKMPQGTGMIFPLKPPRFASFWMENTLLPLDLIFIAPDGKVLNIVQGEPKSRAQLYSSGPAAAVLELNAGEAARIGLEPGDKVEGGF